MRTYRNQQPADQRVDDADGGEHEAAEAELRQPGRRTLTDERHAVDEPIAPGKRTRVGRDEDTGLARRQDLARLKRAVGSLNGPGRPLPTDLAHTFSNLLGVDLSDVLIHTDVTAARDLGAQAFAVGNQIAFAPGRFAPDSPEGKFILAHELIHVAQQKVAQADMAAARMELGRSGSPIEAEADAGATALVTGQSFRVASHGALPMVSFLNDGEGGAPAVDPAGGAGGGPGEPAPAPAPADPAPPAADAGAGGAAPTPAPAPDAGGGGAGGAPASAPGGAGGADAGAGPAPAGTPDAGGGGGARGAPTVDASAAGVEQQLEDRKDPAVKARTDTLLTNVDTFRIQSLQFSYNPSGVWHNIWQGFIPTDNIADHFRLAFNNNPYAAGTDSTDKWQAGIEYVRGVIRLLGDAAGAVASITGALSGISAALALITSETVIGGLGFGAISIILGQISTWAGIVKLIADVLDLACGFVQMIILTQRLKSAPKGSPERTRILSLMKKEAADFTNGLLVTAGDLLATVISAATAGIGSGAGQAAGAAAKAGGKSAAGAAAAAGRATLKEVGAELWKTTKQVFNPKVFAKTVAEAAKGEVRTLAGVLKALLTTSPLIKQEAKLIIQLNVDAVLINAAMKAGKQEVLDLAKITGKAAMRTAARSQGIGALTGTTIGVTAGLGKSQGAANDPAGGAPPGAPGAAGGDPAAVSLSHVAAWPSLLARVNDVRGYVQNASVRMARQYNLAKGEVKEKEAAQVEAGIAKLKQQKADLKTEAGKKKAEAEADAAKSDQQKAKAEEAKGKQDQAKSEKDKADEKAKAAGDSSKDAAAKAPRKWPFTWIGEKLTAIQNWCLTKMLSGTDVTPEEAAAAGISATCLDNQKEEKKSAQEAGETEKKADDLDKAVEDAKKTAETSEFYAIQSMADAAHWQLALDDIDVDLGTYAVEAKRVMDEAAAQIKHELETEAAGANIDAEYVAPITSTTTTFQTQITGHPELIKVQITEASRKALDDLAAQTNADVSQPKAVCDEFANGECAEMARVVDEAKAIAAKILADAEGLIGTTNYDGATQLAQQLEKLINGCGIAVGKIAAHAQDGLTKMLDGAVTTVVDQLPAPAPAPAPANPDAPPPAPAQPKADGPLGALDASVSDGAGQRMPDDVQRKMERAFGADFSAVRIHEGPQAPAMGARAFAQGTDLHFAPGTYDPHSEAGQELLGHELTHVVQQGAGRVTAQGKGGINADASLEAEADAAGARAARGLAATVTGVTSTSSGLQLQGNGVAGHGPNTASAGAATATTVTPKSYAEISAGTVAEFTTYAEDKADWSMEIADPAQQSELRLLLTWLKAADHRKTPISSKPMSDLIAVKADLPKLDAYGRAAADQPTVKITPTDVVAEMVSLGADILKLEAAVAGPILHQVFTGPDLELLRSEARIDLFCNYVRTCAPLLHAKGGVEIRSFRTLADVGDPVSWHNVRDVRNLHRFQGDALTALRTAQAGNPGNKPLTLILHSAFDHNGAFHQDPNITDVITNSANHTIMIEGADSLDAIAARLPSILALHGRTEPDPADRTKTVRRIDQLMIAGHGTATSIELAGTIAENPDGSPQTAGGDLVENRDGLNTAHDPSDPAAVAREARSRAFMQTLMGMMSVDPSSPHRRVVFNACLTASNEIPRDAVDPNATPDEQARQMRAAIANSPSIVDVARAMAPAGGPEVRGGNGSFGQVGLIDGSGALDIVADGAVTSTGLPRTLDPELTNPDKLVYVEQGTDPNGCMSAVAERWAIDRATLIPAVQRRRAAPKGTEWHETVIQALYELVETRYAASGAGIARLASQTTGLSHLTSEDETGPWGIWNITAADDWTLLHSRFSVHGDWAGNPFVPLVFFHAWMIRDPAKIPSFLTAVGAMDVKTIEPFIHMGELINRWSSLVPIIAAPVHGGSLRLALRDLHEHADAPQPNTRLYLTSLVSNHAFTVDVDTPLAGLHDADWALSALGLDAASAAAAPHDASSATPAPPGNVDMDVDGINESLVQPLSVNGRVRVATALYVRDQASTGGRRHSTQLHDGDLVYIMGQTGTWYLLDHDGRRGYSAKAYIDQVETDAAGAVVDPAAAPAVADPPHPTSMSTAAILLEGSAIDGRIAALTGAALTEAQLRKTALDTELGVRRLVVSVTCISTNDFWTDEIDVQVTSASGGQATSVMHTSVAEGATRHYTVPLATLVPLSGALTVNIREADLLSTDTVLSISFNPNAGVGIGMSSSYTASVIFEATASSVSTGGSTLPSGTP